MPSTSTKATHVLTKQKELVQKSLEESIKRQVGSFLRQAEQQRRSPVGFLLKINGTQLHSIAATRRKRPREATNASDKTAKGKQRSSGDESASWPEAVLVALERILSDVESESGFQLLYGSSTASKGGNTSMARALKSINGIELRHCGLRAQHIDAPDKKSVTLARILLSASRFWTSQVMDDSAAPLCSSITTLDLESNSLGDDGVECLRESLLGSLPHLQRLLLASNRITTAGCVCLFRALAHRGPASVPLPLETLGLTNNAVGCISGAGSDDVFHVLLKWMNMFVRDVAPTLRRIHLNHAGLETREAVALIRALFQHTAVERDVCAFDLVYLRENQLVSKADAIRQLHELLPDREEALNKFVQDHVSW